MHMNVDTVDVGCHVKLCAFHLVGCYLNTLMLQLMAGAERLCHVFKWGREMKKVGNHCCRRLRCSILSTTHCNEDCPMWKVKLYAMY